MRSMFVCAALMAAAASFGQFRLHWTERAGQSVASDYADSTADSSGNLVNSSYGNNASGRFLSVSKHAPDGRLIWRSTYSPPRGRIDGRSMAQGKDGSIVSLGMVDYGTEYPERISASCVVKHDKEGNLIWSHQFESMPSGQWLFEDPRRIAVDDRGGVYVCGYSDDMNFVSHWPVYKLSPDGRLEWARRLPAELRRHSNKASRIIYSAESDVVFVLGSKSNGRLDHATPYVSSLVGRAYAPDGTERPYFELYRPISSMGVLMHTALQPTKETWSLSAMPLKAIAMLGVHPPPCPWLGSALTVRSDGVFFMLRTES